MYWNTNLPGEPSEKINSYSSKCVHRWDNVIIDLVETSFRFFNSYISCIKVIFWTVSVVVQRYISCWIDDNNVISFSCKCVYPERSQFQLLLRFFLMNILNNTVWKCRFFSVEMDQKPRIHFSILMYIFLWYVTVHSLQFLESIRLLWYC